MFASNLFEYLSGLTPESSAVCVTECDSLYVDCTEEIRRAAFELICQHHGKVAPPRVDFEYLIVERTIGRLHELVAAAHPTRSLFLAIDGVVPRAQLNDQRARRFKVARERAEIGALLSRRNMPLPCQWDTNAITPGTQFMLRLSRRLRRELAAHPRFAHLEVTFSDSSVPGKGGHKIVAHMRARGTSTRGPIVACGTGFDLVLGTLLLSNLPVHLMRKVGGPFEFAHHDLAVLRGALVRRMQATRGRQLDVCLEEFCILALLVGNDVLPCSPSLCAEDMDTILSAYDGSPEPLIDPITRALSVHSLRCVIQQLAKDEDERLMRRSAAWRAHAALVAQERDVFVRYEHVLPLRDDVRYGSDGWIQRYNRVRLPATEPSRVVQLYLKTLAWAWKYHTGTIRSWEWFFPHHHAPTLADLVACMGDAGEEVQTFADASGPPKPFVQLLAALPPASFALLPSPMKSFLNSEAATEDHATETFLRTCPRRLYEDTILKTRRRECVAILPFVDLNLCADLVRRIVDERNERNALRRRPLFFHPIPKSTLNPHAPVFVPWSKREESDDAKYIDELMRSIHDDVVAIDAMFEADDFLVVGS